MTERFGHYELLAPLARGGLGEVFLARRDGSHEVVVVKRLHPHLSADAEAGALFLREAGVAARLRHPGIVRIRELGEVQGRWFLAMDYVAGKDVGAILERARATRTSIPWSVAARIVARVAGTLAEARQVHRDLSPSNILVGFDGEVKVIDFLSPPSGEGLPGRPGYLAPELLAGEPADARSDQFSLGVILWELLTARSLFEAESDVLTLQRVAACEVPSPRSIRPEVPATLEVLVRKMLAKDPVERWKDLSAIAATLEELELQESLTDFLFKLFPEGDTALRQVAPPPPSSAASVAPPLSPFELSEAERALWAKIQTLPGPLTLEAVESAVEPEQRERVLDVLQALTERGLLRAVEVAGSSELRFELVA